jgi:putative proteasome-type protease
VTYCVGMKVKGGLVLVADTRTNAGIDNISVYRKLHTLADDAEREIFVASAGSLSVTQSMLALLDEGLPVPDDGPPRRVSGCTTMFRVAQLVGEAVATARRAVGQTLADTNINARISILLGGRIADGPLSLYLIYNEGNFIECQQDAPFLQIGELKYGKPILDRALHYDTPLDEAVKLALLSFDATMRSNLSVGKPLDIVALFEDPTRSAIKLRLEADDPYFEMLSREWARLLDEARNTITDPPFMMPSEKAGSGDAPLVA